ncbi:MAG: M64 family metallopeptidase [Candidatus Sedimenticola sp. (ex Thyasira tokunagai)]
MIEPRSIRFTFDNSRSGELLLAGTAACLALAHESHDTGAREGITSYWVQLEDKDSAVLYRRDIPGMMRPLVRGAEPGELETFDVLVPFLKEAVAVTVFAPPRGADGVRPYIGGVSEQIGRFVIPDILERPGPATAPTLPADFCGSGRGQVLSVTKVVYHGRIDNIYNLVILADKFQSNQGSFVKHANACLSYMLSKAPFNSGLGADAMNVFLVEVASNTSGESYFNSTYSSGSTLIDWDTTCVRTVCDALFSVNGNPYWNWAGLVIDYDGRRIGTARGGQFAQGIYTGTSWWDPSTWFKNTDEYVLTFQHEFGHAGFELGDEYSANKGTYSGGEPGNPNLTIVTQKANIKWKGLLTEGVSIPTTNCPFGNAQVIEANPYNDATVGSFVGGRGYECGIFHPQKECVMNNNNDADGAFCAVCIHNATKIVARAAALLVPAPGSIYYSPISGAWSHALVAANVVSPFGTLQNYSDHDAVISELISGTAGTAVRGAFQDVGHPLPQQIEVMQSYYNEGNADDVWYLIAHETHVTHYVHGFQLAIYTELALGEIALPDFPTLTAFDGAVVGIEINLFSVGAGELSYGKLDSSGNIEGGALAVQTVTGLGNQVESVSVDYIGTQIWVAVTDSLSVKIAAYQLLNGAWWSQGFLTMPTSATTDFHAVRTTKAGNTLHVMGASAAGLLHATLNTMTGAWSGNAAITPVTATVGYFDVTTDGTNLYLIVDSPGAPTMFTYTIGSATWGDPVDISSDLGLAIDAVISGFGITILNNTLHVVALVNALAKHAMYDLSTAIWTQPLTDIKPLESIAGEIGAMMVHSTSSQVYVGLSGASPP